MLERKGITPKDHMKENMRHLKHAQSRNREVAIEKSAEPKPLYKLPQFQQVEPRLYEEPYKEPYRQPDGEFLRRGESFKRHEKLQAESRNIRGELERKLEEEANARNESPPTPRKPAVPRAAEVATLVHRSDVDFISRNREDSVFAMPRQASKKAVKEEAPARHAAFGRVPTYLENRKQQWADEEEYRRANAPDPDCPKGMCVMPEQERLETLEVLQQSLREAHAKLSAMPFVIETPSQRKKHEELEAKIKEIENAIGLFSRKKVFIAQG